MSSLPNSQPAPTITNSIQPHDHPNHQNHIQTSNTQIEDQLQRSNRKIKRKITHWIFDNAQQNEEIMVDAVNNQAQPNNINTVNIGGIGHINPGYKQGTPVIPSINGMQQHSLSFKDMVGNAGQSNINEKTNSEANSIFEEYDSKDDEPPSCMEDDSSCPVILLSKEEKQRLRKPWKMSLIIKMFDKNIGYMTLIRRLTKKWQLKGSLNLIDIGFSYYVVKFTNKEDYECVLTGGPWLIDDHYLTIRKWVPNFIPNDEPIKILNAWVRIPDLAIEYFD